MAINTQKFLPAQKSSALPNISQKTIKNISVIKVKVIQIENILKGTIALEKKSLDEKKRKESGTRREKQEEKLETKPNVEKGNIKMPSAPKLGILDWVKNFIGNIILGYFAVRLIDHLPKIIPIVKFLGAAADFIIDIGGKLLNGLASFIDAGYKAYDATRGFIKNLGGENFAKGFDKFTGLIDTALFLTTVLAGSMALEAMSGGDGGGGPGGGRGGGPGGGKPGGKPNVINKGFWNERTGRWQGSFRGKGGEYRTNEAARRYTQRFGRDAATSRFGKEGLDTLGGKYARSGATNLARKGLVGLAGKGGAKAVLGFAKPFLKRLPIIGALIDFGLSVALGEDPGRAAFKAIGAALLGTIGAAVGSLAFGFGGIIGGLLGSIGGDALGGALYDMFFGGKKPQQKNQKVEKKAGGGITRGNKPTSGKIGRTIKKPKRTIRTSPSKVNPGQSIGGEKKIKNIFPEVKSVDKGKKINTYGYMKSSYEKLSSAEAFGGLFALPLKAQLGQEPSKLDYQNAASGLNSWMQRTFSSEIMRTGGVGFAEGGKVEAGMFSNGEDMTKVIEKSLEDSISSKVTASINDLKKQLGLKPDEGESKDKKSDDTGMSGTGDYSPEGLQGEIYKYLISKGMDDIHAIGLMANISRESGFRPGIDEIGGGGGVGLFQYTSEPRKGNFLKAVPDYKTNWKGQIDYALKEPGEPAPQWLAMKFSSSQEAADWFMRKWERPREDIQSTLGPKEHKEYIASLEKYKSKTGKGYDLPSGNLGSKGSAVQYITGDVNYKGDGQQFYYDLKGHGLPGNYHDHIAFKTVEDKEMAKKKLRAANIETGSEYRAGDPGYHGKNLAVDVPGAQWGGGGAIGSKEFDGSKKVRQVLGIGYSKGGETKPYAHTATLGEEGVETVIDADSTKGLASLAPNLLKKLNTAKTKPQLMKILQSYMGGNNQIAATYGEESAEKQQKTGTFMKDMSAGKEFQGRSDVFGRDPSRIPTREKLNAGKLKLQSNNKSSQDTQISANYGEGFSKKNFMDFLEKGYKNNTNDDSRPSRVNALPLAQKSLSSPQIASYASYEQSYPSEVFIPILIPVPTGGGGNSSGSSGGTIIAMGGGSNPFDSLYKGG